MSQAGNAIFEGNIKNDLDNLRLNPSLVLAGLRAVGTRGSARAPRAASGAKGCPGGDRHRPPLEGSGQRPHCGSEAPGGSCAPTTDAWGHHAPGSQDQADKRRTELPTQKCPPCTLLLSSTRRKSGRGVTAGRHGPERPAGSRGLASWGTHPGAPGRRGPHVGTGAGCC